MSKGNQITVFGASNVDITGYTKATLIYKDANIGSMKTTAGGVGRNIAENLQRLDFKVDLISVFGDDPLSDFLQKDCQKKGLQINKSLFVKDAPASTFIAIMDEQNDLALGISAMTLYDELPEKDFIAHLPDQLYSEYSILETNFSSEILQAIIQKYPGQKFVLDTVSGKKSLRALAVLKDLYILKTNLLEAEMMSGMEIKSDTDLDKLVRFFIDKGVQKVFITLGKNGVIYGDKNHLNRQPTIATHIVNTIGAGDSFVAGLVYADSLQLNLDQMATYGMAAASITVQHPEAVSTQMSRTAIENIIRA